MINKELQPSSFRDDIDYIDTPSINTNVKIPGYNEDQLDPRISIRGNICRFRGVGITKPTQDLINGDTFIDTSGATQICIYADGNRYCI